MNARAFSPIFTSESISITEEGRGPLTVPIWYLYEPGGEVRVTTARTSRKALLLKRVERFSLCAQSETAPYTVSMRAWRDRLSRSRRQILSVIAAPSLTVTWAFKQVTGTSRGRAPKQDRTCMFACAPNGGSQWITGRYTGRLFSEHAGRVARARPTRPTPGSSTRLLCGLVDEPPPSATRSKPSSSPLEKSQVGAHT